MTEYPLTTTFPRHDERPGTKFKHSPGLFLLGAWSFLLLHGPAVLAQDSERPLRVSDVSPTGVRGTATRSWAAFHFLLDNLTGEDRQARVLVYYPARPEQQYARDVWVPARATLSTWMLVGPAAAGEQGSGLCDLQILLYDRTGGKDRLFLPPGEQRLRPRGLRYRDREATTSVLLDEPRPDPAPAEVAGRLPEPDSAAEEAALLVLTFRAAAKLSEAVETVRPGSLPPTPEAFDGIDHFVIASTRLADDPAGMRALRQWLERGGKVWVMLDLVDPEVVAPLLGDALDFRLVDRSSLTTFQVETHGRAEREAPEPVQRPERPVTFARVLLPAEERPRHTINGWPVWFTRGVGQGKVVFTTLGPRGWFGPRGRNGPSPFEHFPDLPLPTSPLNLVADELQPQEQNPLPDEAFRPMLTGELGYSVVGRGTAGLVFGAFLAVTVALVLVLRRSRRPELLGWVGPAAALAAAAAFVALGIASRRALPPTVAVAQVVEAVPGTEEVPVRGLLAVYRPDSGSADFGAAQGGLFEPDVSGVEGQMRRLILTDLDSWHWEDLSLPAGVRVMPFRYNAVTGGPLAAVAGFGPDGIEGRLTHGPFRDPTDAVLATPNGRNLAVRLEPDGTFRAGAEDFLPSGQFLPGTVLSDRQQRRQELYRAALKRPTNEQRDRPPVLLAWAEPIDTHFALVPEARTVGDALLTMPLRLERPPPDRRVTIPGPLLTARRVIADGLTPPTRGGTGAADMHLRFQLPPVVLPFRVERARLAAKIDAPGRRMTVAGRAGEQLVELFRADSPADPVRVDLTEARLLRLDEEGGLHVNVAVSELAGEVKGRTARPEDRWQVEYLELEVTGRAD
jgi:hypothetical protein